MAHRIRCMLAVVGALLGLAACGGGGGAVPSAPGRASNAGSAALTFFIPSAAANARSRRPGYLPSTTQSVVITVLNANGTPLSPPVAPTVANVGPMAAGCSSVTGGFQCVVSVSVVMGSLLFSITAYDQPNGAGNVLSTGNTTATIGDGPNSVSVALSATATYAGTNLSGNTQTIAIDHQHGTVVVTGLTGNAFTTNAHYTMLPNGDAKIVVTSSTDPSSVTGEVAYARELPGGALMFIATNSTTPNADGTSPTTDADWGIASDFEPCPTSNFTFHYAGVEILGPTWTVANSTAYTTGTATVTGGTLAFTGTNFLVSGSANGSALGSTQTCSNGIYSGAGSGDVMAGSQGFVVTTSGNTGTQGNTNSNDGGGGFVPAQSISLSALASASYEVFEGGQGTNGTMTVKHEAPYAASPGGVNALTVCPYVNFEANALATTCGTATFTGQPASGLVSGTIVAPSGTYSFVGAVGQIDGKYVIVIASGSTSGGINLVFMQH